MLTVGAAVALIAGPAVTLTTTATADTPSTVLTAIYAGQDSLCTTQLSAAICADPAVVTGFGEGALGWPGHASDWGGPFVEPASFGYVAAGREFNVYEPLSATLVDSLRWLLPQGVDPVTYAAGIAQYNPGWGIGRGIVVPNT